MDQEVEEAIKKSTQESTNEKGKKILKSTTKEWVNRRRPEISANERTVKMQTQQRISNRFAAERLRAEQEKTKLILQQIKQNTELHNIKMENEKHKRDILQTLLKKVQGKNLNNKNCIYEKKFWVIKFLLSMALGRSSIPPSISFSI